MTNIPVMLVPPTAHARSGEAFPLAPPPPSTKKTKLVPVPSSLERLHALQSMIFAQADLEPQWIQKEGFSPRPDRILDYDYMLLVAVDQWLRALKQLTEETELWLPVRAVVADEAMVHPARKSLCGLDGRDFSPSDEWPSYIRRRTVVRKHSTAEVPYSQLKTVLDRLRVVARAGYLILNRIDRQRIQSEYLLAPTIAGVARALKLAQRLNLPLPPFRDSP